MRAYTYIQYMSDVANLSNRIISGLDILKAWFRLCRESSLTILSLRINVTHFSFFANREWRVPCHRQRQQFCLRGWKESLAVGRKVRKVRRGWHESRIDDIPFPQRRGTAAAKTSPWQSVRTDLTRYSWYDKTETTTSTGHRLISSPQRRRRSISLSLTRRDVERRDKFLELDTVRKRRSLQSLPRAEWNPRRNASRV